jgi:5-methyltetrahydrofolate--homocysteine methyltransferase
MVIPMDDILSIISTCVIQGDVSGVVSQIQRALAQGLAPQDILDNGLSKGMNHVGAKFKKGEMFVPEVLLSARAMQSALGVLRPLLVAAGAETVGTMVIGTVKGDLHDIGKNLVVILMEGAGFTVHDLGSDVAPDAFVEAVKKYHPQILGMSALLTTTMRSMDGTIQALKNAGLRDQLKIMVGGAPVTAEFAKQIGADAYASSAPAAAETARRLVGTG